jgi:hypothetical protein
MLPLFSMVPASAGDTLSSAEADSIDNDGDDAG